MFNLIESRKKSGLAKAATILATGFGISLGLCGLNAFTLQVTKADPLAGVFVVTAYLELAAMIVCAIGLAIVAIIAIVRIIFMTTGKENNE